MNQELSEWSEQMKGFKLPRWEELPEFDLYMEQVITLLDRYLSPVIDKEKYALLTNAMVNNYVKHKLIPPPNKKKYTRVHLAYLIVITLLKQILTISEIQQAITLQAAEEPLEKVYDDFCEKQERAFSIVAETAISGKLPEMDFETAEVNKLTIYGAVYAFAAKALAEKIIVIQVAENRDSNETTD